MNNQVLEIKAGLHILKPIHEVFEAIVDPVKMTHYFISKGSAIMEEGKTVTWQFPEMDLEFPIRVGKIEQHKYISFHWADMEGNATLVEMQLTFKGESVTFVVVTEKSKENNENGLKWLKSNTEGWANFLACLKAYLEYGINLRKGAFDLSQMPEEMQK